MYKFFYHYDADGLIIINHILLISRHSYKFFKIYLLSW